MTVKDLEERLNHRLRMQLAGDSPPQVPTSALGPPVQIWRLHRDKTVTLETLPEHLAEITIANIVHNEPNVARAKIIRRSPSLDSFLLSAIFDRMATAPAIASA